MATRTKVVTKAPQRGANEARAEDAEGAEVHGALLDVDGTLLDSNDAHARSWVEALAQQGVMRDLGEVRRLIGMGSDRLLPALGVDAESEQGKALTELRTRIFRERYLPHLEPFADARALVERMLGSGLALVVATSAGKEEAAALLERARVADLLKIRTSADDAEESKPSPDIVEVAVKRAGHDARHLVLLGDTPYDVRAARRAGVRAVGVLSGGWSAGELSGATAIYADAADLFLRFEESPFARTTRGLRSPS